jgi:hypothetical protein
MSPLPFEVLPFFYHNNSGHPNIVYTLNTNSFFMIIYKMVITSINCIGR